MIRAKIISFTARGAQTGSRIAQALYPAHAEQYSRGIDQSIKKTNLSRMVQQAMVDCDLIVFVGACGIAVRSCAPYLQGKQYDPAVLVVDENAKFVISLLSGHIGGANALTEQLAQALGAQAVITTATDGRRAFAVDTWAQQNDCTVHEVPRIKYISGAILAGDPVGLYSDFPLEGELPKEIRVNGPATCGIVLSVRTQLQPFAHTLHVIPRVVHLGIGCRRGTPAEQIEAFLAEILNEEHIPFSAILRVASIDLKQDELGLCMFCKQHNLPFVTYSAHALAQAPGSFTTSDFVQKTVSVDNVCERSAVLSSCGGPILRKKTARDGMTAALAIENWRAHF